MAQTPSTNENAVSKYLADFFETQKTNDFKDLEGLDIALAIPLTQAVLDDLLRPVPFPEQVRSFRLRFSGPDLIVLEVGVKVLFFNTTVRIEARVERYVAFPHDPILKLTMLTGGLAELGLNVIPLPDWIQVDGKSVRLDLGYLLRQGKLDWLIKLLRDVRFNVKPGVLNLEAHITAPKPKEIPI
jgi:hypothetical protein